MASSSTQETLRKLFDDWIYEVKKDLHTRGSFWTPTLITQPAEARTVVLRSLEERAASEAELPGFIVHTDIRAKKWDCLKQSPACALHFYCAKRKWQMRLDGVARLHAQDNFAHSQWQQLSPRSQRIYALKHPPGESVDDPELAYCFEEDDRAFENFGALSIQVSKLDSLQLEQPDRTDYHIRAAWNLETGELSYLAP